MLALSMALAIFTKATAWLFLPPLVLYIAFVFPRRILLWTAAAILLINGPQFARNIRLSGSPLGYDSAQGDGYFRWRNEFPPRIARLNALRHTSEQIGAQCPLESGHLRCRPERPPRARARPQRSCDHPARQPLLPALNANHEANANNRWHLLLYVFAALFAFLPLATARGACMPPDCSPPFSSFACISSGSPSWRASNCRCSSSPRLWPPGPSRGSAIRQSPSPCASS